MTLDKYSEGGVNNSKSSNSFNKHTQRFLIALTLTLGCIGLSSCIGNKLKIPEYKTKVLKDSVDITGGHKIIIKDGNTLKIKDEISGDEEEIFTCNQKNFQVCIQYKNDTKPTKENLISTINETKFERKPLKRKGKIYIRTGLLLDPDSIPDDIKIDKLIEKIEKTDSITLYTRQESLFTGLTESEESQFQIEEPKAGEVFTDFNPEIFDNEKFYIEQSHAAKGYQMIQTMLKYGTTNFSPENFKKHLERIVIINLGEQGKGNYENTIKTIIPNAKIETITDDTESSRISKIIKYSYTHPEEIIILPIPSNKNGDDETNFEENIDELRELNNVYIIEGAYSNTQIALIGMAAQIDPNIRNAKDLEKLIKSSSLHFNKDNEGEETESVSIPNIGLIIQKRLMPTNFPSYINYTDNIEGKYKLRKGEYPLIIFDIPGTITEYEGTSTTFNEENSYILNNNTTLSGCDRYISNEELMDLGYETGEYIVGNRIALDENGRKITTGPIKIELRQIKE